MSIESVMPFNHLILCHPRLLPPSVFPIIRVFSNESVLCIRWPKYQSFSFSISPSNEYSMISFSIFNHIIDRKICYELFKNQPPGMVFWGSLWCSQTSPCSKWKVKIPPCQGNLMPFQTTWGLIQKRKIKQKEWVWWQGPGTEIRKSSIIQSPPSAGKQKQPVSLLG